MITGNDVREAIRRPVYAGQRALLRMSDAAVSSALDVTDPYSMLSQRKRISLYREGRAVLESGKAGAFAELGVYRGGGLGMLGGLFAEYPNVPIHLFDRWGDFLVASEEDGVWKEQFTAENIPQLLKEGKVDEAEAATRELYTKRWNLPADRITYHVGWFSDTLPTYDGGPIVFAHIDADFYESSSEAFAFLEDHLAPEATVVLDDWGAWPGVEKAFYEWKSRSKRKLDLTPHRSRQAIVKVTP